MRHLTAPDLQGLEKQELQQQQEAFMTEVEQWSQGEVEAIQAAAAAKLAQEQRAVKHW
jgi:sulfur relay (sulfurtransferase) DsrC/TusE family protein